jgi:hypothetical protein
MRLDRSIGIPALFGSLARWCLGLVVAIEREFAIAIPEGKVDQTVFRSVRALALWIKQRIAERDATGAP